MFTKIGSAYHPNADSVKIGARVRVTYFDPSSPNSVDGMTTEYGTVTDIKGDPFTCNHRPIIVKLDGMFGGTLDYFTSSLAFDVKEV